MCWDDEIDLTAAAKLHIYLTWNHMMMWFFFLDKPIECKRKEELKYNHRHSYLLRLWRSEDPGASDWRASLEVPETGKRIGFASLEQLFAFLMDLSESNGDLQHAKD